MNDAIQARMLNAVYACMLPLAKLLLRSGITYKQFESVAKRAFVKEGTADPEGRGRATNTSRVAVKTGLSRKDVKRIRDALAADRVSETGSSADQSGPPARVLHAWYSDRRFAGNDGKPRDLEFHDENSGFCGLVRAVAGDVPPGAVRAELKHSGAVIELEDGRLRVVKRYYVPGNVGEKAITALSGMVFPLASGIVHNTDPARIAEGFIQRFAFTESLDPVSATAFREWSREQASMFIEKIDDWLAEHEVADRQNPPKDSIESQTVGIGVFYYEGPSAEDALNEESRPSW